MNILGFDLATKTGWASNAHGRGMMKKKLLFIISLLLFSITAIAMPPTPGQHPSNSPTAVSRSMLSVQPIIYPGLDFDAQTGSFTAFNTITGATSGATATIIGVVDTGSDGRLYLESISGTFQDDEIIYESAEGAELNSGNLTVGVFIKLPLEPNRILSQMGPPIIMSGPFSLQQVQVSRLMLMIKSFQLQMPLLRMEWFIDEKGTRKNILTRG